MNIGNDEDVEEIELVPMEDQPPAPVETPDRELQPAQ